MKRNDVNKIFKEQIKRRNKIIKYITLSAISFIIALLFLYLFIKKNNLKNVTYTEDAKINYEVILKDNDFYDDKSQPQNREYIATLIDNINTKFYYKLKLNDTNIDYSYTYRIAAEVNVKNKATQKIIYSFSEDLVQEKTNYVKNNEEALINEKISINYKKYNALITKFVNIFDLDNSVSELEIKMYVTSLGDCDRLEDADRSSVSSLIIPLTTKTVAIDIKENIVDGSQEKLLVCTDKANPVNYLFLIAAIVFALSSGMLSFLCKSYAKRTRTPESVYEKEFRKILNNYKSYIQKVTNDVSLTGCKMMYIDTFVDMLEIRDTINKPILMVENKDKNSVYFLIIDNNKVGYCYRLNIKDIKTQMQQEQLAKSNK